jgi:hypothetical protein
MDPRAARGGAASVSLWADSVIRLQLLTSTQLAIAGHAGTEYLVTSCNRGSTARTRPRSTSVNPYSRKGSPMAIAFFVALRESDFDKSIGGWRCEALKIPGSSLAALYASGAKIDSAKYSVQEDLHLIRWPSDPRPLDPTAEIRLTSDLQLKGASQPGSAPWWVTALVAIITALITAVGGYYAARAKSDPSPPSSSSSSQDIFDERLATLRRTYAHSERPIQFERGSLSEFGSRTMTLDMPAGNCVRYIAAVLPSAEMNIGIWRNGQGARDVRSQISGDDTFKTGTICTSEVEGQSAQVGIVLRMTRGSGPFAIETFFMSQRVFGPLSPASSTDR